MTIEEIENLIEEYGNARYDVGMYFDSDSDKLLDRLSRAEDEAGKRLLEAIKQYKEQK